MVWHINGDTENLDLSFINIFTYDDAIQLISDIKKYFEENGGTLEKIKQKNAKIVNKSSYYSKAFIYNHI